MACLIAFLLFFLANGWPTYAVDYELDGSCRIVYSTSAAKTFSKTHSTLHMLFRTAEPSGLLLHARGTNGDFTTLEIVRGKLRYASAFGLGSAKPGIHDVIVGDDLGDDQWHQIDIERNKNNVVIKLDITRKYLTAERVQAFQNINKDITVAGLPPSTTEDPNNSSVPRKSLTGSTFIGCMADVTLNKINIFKATKKKSKDVTVLGVLRPQCAEDAEYYPPATLSKSTSLIKLSLVNGQDFNFGFKFRTFDHTGVIVQYTFGATSMGHLFLELIHGKLKLSYGSQNSNINEVITTKYPTYANGFWHKVHFNLTSNGVAIQVNDDTTERFFNVSDVFQNPNLKIGTDLSDKSSVRGCVKEIQLNGTYVKITRSISQYVDLDQCYLNDVCFINPCLHNGICTQHDSVLQCDCTNIGYYGSRCENISALPHYNTASTQKASSSINTRSFGVLPSTIKPSQITTEVMNKISKSITTQDHSAHPSTTTTEKRNNSSVMNSKSSGRIPQTTIRHSQTITKVLKTITLDTFVVLTSTTESLPITLPSSTNARITHTTGMNNPRITRNSTQTSHVQSKQAVPLTSKQSSAILQQTISLMTTQIASALPTQSLEASTTSKYPPTNSVRPTLPSKPTHRTNTHIIIIERSNTITKVGFNKNQLLVYLFLFIVFILFVGLIVIISVKLSYFQACSCLRRLQTSNGPPPSHDSIELGRQDTKDSPRGDNQLRAKTGRPSSLNDSGIDRSESGTDSHRSSAEMHDEAIVNRGDLGTKLEDDQSREGFLILPEDPSLYTQQSFGWTLLGTTSTIRHCRTSTKDLIHTGNENKPRVFEPEYYPNSEISDDMRVHSQDDVNQSSQRYGNPTTKYRQLATSDCSSLDNVSVDVGQCDSPDIRDISSDCVVICDECPVF